MLASAVAIDWRRHHSERIPTVIARRNERAPVDVTRELVSGRASASMLAHDAHRFVFDLLLVDASVRYALSHALDHLEAKGHGRML
jgi:hypothetical protein